MNVGVSTPTTEDSACIAAIAAALAVTLSSSDGVPVVVNTASRFCFLPSISAENKTLYCILTPCF
nr:MAG TPA: hypothetical protein [Caudoviricetes sp.]